MEVIQFADEQEIVRTAILDPVLVARCVIVAGAAAGIRRSNHRVVIDGQKANVREFFSKQTDRDSGCGPNLQNSSLPRATDYLENSAL